MPSTVSANMMTVVHATSIGMTATFPDTCKTPTPGGPVPIPYPNIAMSKDTAQGSTTVKCDGNPINIKSSNFMMSNGDQAGAAMGVMSNKIMGKATWLAYSFDVKADGKNVCRLLDMMRSNGASSENTPPSPCVQAPMPDMGSPGGGGAGGGAGGKKAKKAKKSRKQKKKEKREACKALEKNKMDKGAAQKQSGQLPEHFDANCKTAQNKNVAVTFRDTNPACADHIRSGVPSKPLSIKDKTGKAGEVFGDGSSAAGLVKDKAGNPVTLGGSKVTGDYDMHDMIDMGTGKSIPGGSAAEAGMIDSLNKGMKGAAPGATNPMVNHGPWSEWKNPPPGIDKCSLGNTPAPDGSGITAIVPNKKTGKPDFYHLKTKKDWENFRKCKGK